MYTKSTMLVEDVDVLGQHTHVTSTGGASVYMMCICEQPARADASSAETQDATVRIGMVCIDTASGDIVYDEWEDGELRQNLASRVAHLQPRELLLPEQLSDTTSKLLKRLVAPLALSQASAVRSCPLPCQENTTRDQWRSALTSPFVLQGGGDERQPFCSGNSREENPCLFPRCCCTPEQQGQ